MFASSGEVDRFIKGLNDGTIRISPEANRILVDDGNGNKQPLASRLAEAVKEYEYSSSFTITPHPAAVTLCKAAISEVLSYGVVEFTKISLWSLVGAWERRRDFFFDFFLGCLTNCCSLYF